MSRVIELRMPDGRLRELSELSEAELRDYCENLSREIETATQVLRALAEYGRARFGSEPARLQKGENDG